MVISEKNRHLMKISTFDVMKKYFPTKEFLPGNRIDTTNGFMDRYCPKLGRKIAAEWFLFINKCYFFNVCEQFSRFFRSPNWAKFPRAAVLLLEQKGSTSHLDARGTPSTMFPRGRLVETECDVTCEARFDGRIIPAEPTLCDNRNIKPEEKEPTPASAS